MGNYVASPLSVLVLLSSLLVSKGPSGESAREICEAVLGEEKKEACRRLDYTDIEKTLNKIRTVVQNSRSRDGRQILSLSNAAFLKRGLRISSAFTKKFASLKGDHVEEVLFNTSEAFNRINQWARSSTNDLIEEFLKSRDELSAETIMVLLNAISFKEKWKKTFMEEKTVKADFYLRKDVPVKVPMMHLETQMAYIDKEDYKVVVKRFENDQFSFLIFLPKSRFNLNAIENDLKSDDFKWEIFHKSENYTQVGLALPKFKIEHKIDLKRVLSLLGVRRLFTRGAANLTGISADPRLYAEEAKQVAMLEVNEAGVKAAAVSSVSIMLMSLPRPPSPFVVDQPFYCAIYDSALEMPLFIARVADPR